MGEVAISLENVSKCFKRYARPIDRLKELILPGKSRAEEFWALRGVSLEVAKGETLGIIGQNGSGKSTLLQIVAGTLTPTSGRVKVNGRVSALLELGSGFNPEFTGRQNVFFNGQILGLSKAEIEQKFDDIAAFADIGDFIEQPVKTYSSGMFVRLAFAVAVNVDPEIFIVDEALAVGDIVFQYRCMRRIRALMDAGATTLFVSHDSGAIKTLCNAAVMLHHGKVFTAGLPNNVVIEYMKAMMHQELDATSEQGRSNQNNQEASHANAESVSNNPLHRNKTRRGNRKAMIEDVKLLNQAGEFCGDSPVFTFNETVTLLVTLQVYEPLRECIVGFFICDKNGNEIIGSNTYEENVKISDLTAGEQLNVQFKFSLPLRMGSYSLTVAGASYAHETFDWLDNVVVFQVLPPDTGRRVHALVDVPIDVDVDIIREEVSVS